MTHSCQSIKKRFHILLLVLAFSCTPEPVTLSWMPINYDELVYQMNNPTGHLIDNDIHKTQAHIEESLGIPPGSLSGLLEDLEIIYNQIAIAKKAIEDNNVSDDIQIGSSSDKEVEGSTVYLRIACSGEDPDNPTTDFSDGEMYMEGTSFALSEIIADGLVLNGHMLLRFDECLSESYYINGSNPGYIDGPNNMLALNLHVNVSSSLFSNVEVRVPLLMDDSRFSFLVDGGEEGTYVMTVITTEDASITLSVEEGDFSCSFTGGDLGCIDHTQGSRQLLHE